MSSLPEDPIAKGGIEDFARRLRAGETTAEKATRAYIDRIDLLDGRLGAFQHVARDQALAAARAIDRLLAAGTDLGPLMGVPVAVKDLFAIDGMPATAGSRLDVADLIGGEGRFVKMLKRAGCVILGKTKTVEFALGAMGTNAVRGTPWNPWDPAVHRLPGGSSSGSAVAVAAGMTAFAIGSDTGGSVRIPAAFTGIFGLKTTTGVFPTDGVFPLSPTLDTIGPLCQSAADAAVVFQALTGQAVPARDLETLKFGKPADLFYENLDDAVAQAMDEALDSLRGAGVAIVDIEAPEVRERAEIFPVLLPSELIAVLGRERFETGRSDMDPVVAERASAGLDMSAIAYLKALWRHRELAALAPQRFAGLDGWVTPTVPIVAAPVSEALDPEGARRLTPVVNQNTQPGNLLRLCGISMPTPSTMPLPVGFQVLAAGGNDAGVLGIALALEAHFGRPVRPDLAAFTG